MWIRWLAVSLVVVGLTCCITDPVAAVVKAQGSDQHDHAEPKIVPVLVIQPGEAKEIIFSTRCTVGITRSAGLQIGEMRDGRTQLQKSQRTVGDQLLQMEGKSWNRDGVTVEVPDFQAATKFAAAPKYTPLAEQGIAPFLVKVSAALDAKPGLIELHLADQTCNGQCQTDFRVLVTAK